MSIENASMVRSILYLAAVVLFAITASVHAIPAAVPNRGDHGRYRGFKRCTPQTEVVRYDFQKLPPEDRKAYTDAVKCMMAQPSQLDPELYPGARNRYLDYATVHLNRTLNVHLDGFFFTWHRMFVWLFEQDLRRTCSYKGTQPYWSWPSTADNLRGSIIFNGDEYSMSGDGEYIDTGPIVLAPTLQFPKGTGGGCVTNGPFAGLQYTMNIIPTSVLLRGGPLPPNAFDYNPQCLTRDLNTYVAQRWTNYTAQAQLLAAPNLATFESLINGSPARGELGLHSGAHFTMGNPAANLFASVQDPIWFPLHAYLDNLYTTWQNSHPDIALSLTGTGTALNTPPSPNVTLDSYEPDWNYFFPTVQVRELMSTTAGPFCYRYE